jgi:hypothetical protein
MGEISVSSSTKTTSIVNPEKYIFGFKSAVWFLALLLIIQIYTKVALERSISITLLGLFFLYGQKRVTTYYTAKSQD